MRPGNQNRAPDDYLVMDCQHAQTLISAALDGEVSETERAALDVHLATCPSCSAFAADAELVQRLVRVAPAPSVPDLTPAILASLPEPPHPRRDDPALRLGLFGIALLLGLLALPSLLGPDTHEQHLASFDVALTVGFVWVAARPTRALSGFLPIGSALVLSCVTLSAIDFANGRGESLRLITHSAAVLGMIVTWWLEAHVQRRPAGEVRLAA